MRRAAGLYGPFLIVALIQALVIVVAPSRPAPTPTVAGGPAPAASAPGTAPQTSPQQGATGAPLAAPSEQAPQTGAAAGPASGGSGTASGPAGQQSDGTATAAGGGDPTGAEGGSSGGDGGQGGGTSTAQARGDTSHCTEDGKQFDDVYHAPPCAPKWPAGADNGGATYRGVTRDKITVVQFRENKNQQVTAVLSAEGLRATREQEEAFLEASEDFINEHYELYGRELDLVLYDAEQCPETPPDVPACKQEARRVIKEHQPFAVIWPVPTYPTVFDEWVRQGVISLGGWHFDNSYFAGRRPYRYDVFMDGTRTAEFIGEYYCSKLAGKPASNAGPVIHRSYPNGGQRDLVQRRLGVLTQDTEANRLAAEHLVDIVSRCDDRPPVLATYESNIDTGVAQSEGNTPKFLENEVTTLVCMCDPITPVFRTNENDQNGWYPEYLMAGSGLLDFDKLGRLYNPQTQWLHAFGPSHLGNPYPTNETDQAQIWQATGHQGSPCGGACGLYWPYYNLVASMIQLAGPDVTPATVEQGLLTAPPNGGWQQTGGDPHTALLQFGQRDYSGISDIREVYWDNNRNSSIDGRPGSYAPMNGGRRYRQGEIPTGFDIPAKDR